MTWNQIVYAVLALIVIIIVAGLPLYTYANERIFGGEGIIDYVKNKWSGKETDFVPYQIRELTLEEKDTLDSVHALICAINSLVTDKYEFENCLKVTKKKNKGMYGDKSVTCDYTATGYECTVKKFELPQDADEYIKNQGLDFSEITPSKTFLYYEGFPEYLVKKDKRITHNPNIKNSNMFLIESREIAVGWTAYKPVDLAKQFPIIRKYDDEHYDFFSRSPCESDLVVKKERCTCKLENDDYLWNGVNTVPVKKESIKLKEGKEPIKYSNDQILLNVVTENEADFSNAIKNCRLLPKVVYLPEKEYPDGLAIIDNELVLTTKCISIRSKEESAKGDIFRPPFLC